MSRIILAIVWISHKFGNPLETSFSSVAKWAGKPGASHHRLGSMPVEMPCFERFWQEGIRATWCQSRQSPLMPSCQNRSKHGIPAGMEPSLWWLAPGMPAHFAMDTKDVSKWLPNLWLIKIIAQILRDMTDQNYCQSDYTETFRPGSCTECAMWPPK